MSHPTSGGPSRPSSSGTSPSSSIAPLPSIPVPPPAQLCSTLAKYFAQLTQLATPSPPLHSSNSPTSSYAPTPSPLLGHNATPLVDPQPIALQEGSLQRSQATAILTPTSSSFTLPPSLAFLNGASLFQVENHSSRKNRNALLTFTPNLPNAHLGVFSFDGTEVASIGWLMKLDPAERQKEFTIALNTFPHSVAKHSTRVTAYCFVIVCLAAGQYGILRGIPVDDNMGWIVYAVSPFFLVVKNRKNALAGLTGLPRRPARATPPHQQMQFPFPENVVSNKRPRPSTDDPDDIRIKSEPERSPASEAYLADPFRAMNLTTPPVGAEGLGTGVAAGIRSRTSPSVSQGGDKAQLWLRWYYLQLGSARKHHAPLNKHVDNFDLVAHLCQEFPHLFTEGMRPSIDVSVWVNAGPHGPWPDTSSVNPAMAAQGGARKGDSFGRTTNLMHAASFSPLPSPSNSSQSLVELLPRYQTNSASGSGSKLTQPSPMEVANAMQRTSGDNPLGSGQRDLTINWPSGSTPLIIQPSGISPNSSVGAGAGGTDASLVEYVFPADGMHGSGGDLPLRWSGEETFSAALFSAGPFPLPAGFGGSGSTSTSTSSHPPPLTAPTAGTAPLEDLFGIPDSSGPLPGIASFITPTGSHPSSKSNSGEARKNQ